MSNAGQAIRQQPARSPVVVRGRRAALASLLWFSGLGYGAPLLGPLFRRRSAWQLLDAFVAVVRVTTGLRVLFGL